MDVSAWLELQASVQYFDDPHLLISTTFQAAGLVIHNVQLELQYMICVQLSCCWPTSMDMSSHVRINKKQPCNTVPYSAEKPFICQQGKEQFNFTSQEDNGSIDICNWPSMTQAPTSSLISCIKRAGAALQRS